MTTSTMAHEEMVATLESTGQYRVLRKLVPRTVIHAPDGTATRKAVFIDFETTGLDPAKHEIIEIAMVPFTYSADGRIFEIGEPYQSLQQPNNPIPAEATAIHGITDAMVAGKSIDIAAVLAPAQDADLIIAHNAGFDRKFAEQLHASFAAKAWGCSMSQVDWKAEGFEGTRLGYLASGAGFFYDRHRAIHDCLAAIEMLATTLPKSGTRALAQLLAKAHSDTIRIYALGAPYELKDVLKARGYRWNDGSNGNPRAWHIDVDERFYDAEADYLAREIYQRDVQPITVRMTARERFSDRV